MFRPITCGFVNMARDRRAERRGTYWEVNERSCNCGRPAQLTTASTVGGGSIDCCSIIRNTVSRGPVVFNVAIEAVIVRGIGELLMLIFPL